MSVKFPVISNSQFALLFCEADTGIILYKDLERYNGQGNYYFVFDSFKDAENYAIEIIKKNTSVYGVIFNSENSVVKTISDESKYMQFANKNKTNK